jgi:hypothetical protein
VSSRDIGRRLGDKWTWHRYAGVAVFWEKTVWQGSGDEANQFVYPDNQNRRLLSLPLVHRATGRKVFFDVTHLENDGDPATDGHRARLVETKAMAARAKAGDRVLGWDCNSTTLATENTTPRQREKPRVIAASVAGFRFVTNLPAVLNRKLASHHGGKRATPNGDWIDDIGIRGNLAFESAELIRTDQTDASDHHVLRATVSL